MFFLTWRSPAVIASIPSRVTQPHYLPVDRSTRVPNLIARELVTCNLSVVPSRLLFVPHESKLVTQSATAAPRKRIAAALKCTVVLHELKLVIRADVSSREAVAAATRAERSARRRPPSRTSEGRVPVSDRSAIAG